MKKRIYYNTQQLRDVLKSINGVSDANISIIFKRIVYMGCDDTTKYISSKYVDTILEQTFNDTQIKFIINQVSDVIIK